MSPRELRAKGIEVLARELGPVGMARFMLQFESGSGDYTAERDSWLDGLGDVRAVADRVRGLAEGPREPPPRKARRRSGL